MFHLHRWCKQLTSPTKMQQTLFRNVAHKIQTPGNHPKEGIQLHETCIFFIDFRNILKYQISWHSVQWELSFSMWTDGQTDAQMGIYNQAKSHFSQFCEQAQKPTFCCLDLPLCKGRIWKGRTYCLPCVFNLRSPTRVVSPFLITPEDSGRSSLRNGVGFERNIIDNIHNYSNDSVII